jgi:hypothetical protein
MPRLVALFILSVLWNGMVNAYNLVKPPSRPPKVQTTLFSSTMDTNDVDLLKFKNPTGAILNLGAMTRKIKSAFTAYRDLEASGKLLDSDRLPPVHTIVPGVSADKQSFENIVVSNAASLGRLTGKIIGGSGPEFWRD